MNEIVKAMMDGAWQQAELGAERQDRYVSLLVADGTFSVSVFPVGEGDEDD